MLFSDSGAGSYSRCQLASAEFPSTSIVLVSSHKKMPTLQKGSFPLACDTKQLGAEYKREREDAMVGEQAKTTLESALSNHTYLRGLECLQKTMPRLSI